MSIITIKASLLSKLITAESRRVGGVCPVELEGLGSTLVHVSTDSRNAYVAGKYVRSVGRLSEQDLRRAITASRLMELSTLSRLGWGE